MHACKQVPTSTKCAITCLSFSFLPPLPNYPSKNRSGALQMLRHPWISGAQGLSALQKPVKDLLDRLV